MRTVFVNKQSMDLKSAKTTRYLNLENGFFEGINYQNWKDIKDCQIDNPLSCNFVQIILIPDGLLPSRARFRFSLTMQKYKVFLSNKKQTLFLSNKQNYDYFCREFLQAFTGTHLNATNGIHLSAINGTHLSTINGTHSPLSAVKHVQQVKIIFSAHIIHR